MIINAHLEPSGGKTIVSFSGFDKVKGVSERNLAIKDLINRALPHIQVEEDKMIKQLWESRHLLKLNSTLEDYALFHCEALGIKSIICQQELIKRCLMD